MRVLILRFTRPVSGFITAMWAVMFARMCLLDCRFADAWGPHVSSHVQNRRGRKLQTRISQGAVNTSADMVEADAKNGIFQRAASLLGFGSMTADLDWSFLDAVYLITCPNADPEAERLNHAKDVLADINLVDRVQVKEFDTDDEDRIRGCYTSHISVLKDALKDTGGRTEGNPFEQMFKAFGDQENRRSASVEDARVLVLEDNFALSGSLDQSLLGSIANYATSGASWDMIHLSYTPYVPNLVVSRTENDKVVKLSCGVGSALGTSAYLINTSAIRKLLKEHEKQGYYAPIPDVMANVFPETRYSAFPTPFVRAPSTKSLVNPQLDDLRSILFRPAVTSQAQNLLVYSGLSTNLLLPITIVLLLLGTILSASSSLSAAWSLLATGSYDGPLLLPVLSTFFALGSLAILAQGFLLAPNPQDLPSQEVEVNKAYK